MHSTHNIKIVIAQQAKTIYSFKDIKFAPWRWHTWNAKTHSSRRFCAPVMYISGAGKVSSQPDHQQTRTPNTHRWHTHAVTYCIIIQTQRTQISGRNNNGTKHSGGPPEDGREKRPKHAGVLYLQTCF